MEFEFHSVEAIDDPCLVPALQLYEEAFPLHEQMTASFWIATLLNLKRSSHRLLVARAGDGSVIGMVFYEWIHCGSAAPVARLWYLCTAADKRGAGLGAALYGRLVSSLFAAAARAVVFEVEQPDEARAYGDEAAALAQRRIQWYRRQGAKLLLNVSYLQHVDNGLPPTPMHLMVHTPEAVTGDYAFELATRCAGLRAHATGQPVLE